MRLKPLEQQVVVLFGASSGIGRETALRMAARGAKVVAAARGESGLSSLMREIRRGGGGEAIAICADRIRLRAGQDSRRPREDVKSVANRPGRRPTDSRNHSGTPGDSNIRNNAAR